MALIDAALAERPGEPPSRGACLPCDLRLLGMPRGVRGTAHVDEAREIAVKRRRIGRGEHVYRRGDPCDALYACRSGFFKSYVESDDGHAQVTGFPMPGDVTGFDGIAGGTHTQSAVALEDGEVCVVPLAGLEEALVRVPRLLRRFTCMMSGEIVRGQDLATMLGTARAEARVASFLLRLAQRFAIRGYSAHDFNLRMTRGEIGDYLGLELETVSRLLSRFAEQRLIRVRGRRVELLDLRALEQIAGERDHPLETKAA